MARVCVCLCICTTYTCGCLYMCVCVGWRINRSLRMFKQPVFSPCFSHALSRFTGQAVGGLITLQPYVTDWHSAKSGIRIR